MKYPIAATTLLSLALLCTACAEAPASNTSGTALPETAAYSRACADMTISLPEDWAWETLEEENLRGIRFWPESDPTATAVLSLDSNSLVCSFVSSREDVVYENGYAARVSTDDYGDSVHINVRYRNVPAPYYLNYTWTYAQMETYSTVMAEILDSIVLDPEVIREETVLTLAESYKTKDDQILRAKYDYEAGAWTVGIYPVYGGMKPVRTVVIDTQGNVVETVEGA